MNRRWAHAVAIGCALVVGCSDGVQSLCDLVSDECGHEHDDRCDDGTAPTCNAVPPECGAGSILAHQHGCFECVNALTCKPWGEPGCEVDADCPVTELCAECAAASCPTCDDCVSACVAYECDTDPVVGCRAVRPECGDDQVAIARDGCWQCVSVQTCEPAR